MTTVLNRNAQLPAENSKLGFMRLQLKATTNAPCSEDALLDQQGWSGLEGLLSLRVPECSEELSKRRKWPASKSSRARDGWSPAYKPEPGLTWLRTALLCFAMLRCASLCFAMLRYASLVSLVVSSGGSQ